MKLLWRDILKIHTGSTFAGRFIFNINYPFDPSDFVHFRQAHRKRRNGEDLQTEHRSVWRRDMIRKEVKEVRVDTTVQEKNITFPTDRKLTEKIIEHCKRIAKKEDIKLKRTYTFEIQKLK